ncbi:virion core protein, T7 gp14 family [Cupriavidus sp. 30B13]|uniref:virion core protein, T7 gp14 family n=1 Tax=Cupriavidus sp. 30B13 TaxID=3384241 RepID=UPI003B91F282
MCFATGGATAGAGGASLLGGASAGGGGSWASLLPAVVGAAGSAASAGNATAGQQTVARYNASVADRNAGLAELQAQDAERQGVTQEMRLRQQTAQLRGKQRAATAANGVSLAEGSPVNIAASTEYMRDVDIDTIRNNAARAAWGYRVQADNYRANASAYRAGADAVSPTGSAATSLLGSASGVASKWYDLYKNGAFSNGAPAVSGGGRGTYTMDTQYPDQE